MFSLAVTPRMVDHLHLSGTSVYWDINLFESTSIGWNLIWDCKKPRRRNFHRVHSAQLYLCLLIIFRRFTDKMISSSVTLRDCRGVKHPGGPLHGGCLCDVRGPQQINVWFLLHACLTDVNTDLCWGRRTEHDVELCLIFLSEREGVRPESFYFTLKGTSARRSSRCFLPGVWRECCSTGSCVKSEKCPCVAGRRGWRRQKWGLISVSLEDEAFVLLHSEVL